MIVWEGVDSNLLVRRVVDNRRMVELTRFLDYKGNLSLKVQ